MINWPVLHPFFTAIPSTCRSARDSSRAFWDETVAFYASNRLPLVRQRICNALQACHVQEASRLPWQYQARGISSRERYLNVRFIGSIKDLKGCYGVDLAGTANRFERVLTYLTLTALRMVSEGMGR